MAALNFYSLLEIILLFVNVRVSNAVLPGVLISEEKRAYKEVTCVVDQVGFDSGLTFNFPLSNGARITREESYYVHKGGEIKHKWQCNVEDGKPCNIADTKVKTMQSGRHVVAPVTDKRWENFNTYFVRGLKFGSNRAGLFLGKRFNYKKFPIISISIRAERDAKLALCDSKNSQNEGTFCFWILFDAGVNKTTQMFRKCPYGVPKKFPIYAPCKMNQNKIRESLDLIRESKWTHLLFMNDRGNISIYESKSERIVVNYYDEDASFDTLYYLFMDNDAGANGLWKIHEYNYLSLEEEKEYVRIATFHPSMSSDTFCVSLYVAVCKHCTLYVILTNNKGDKTEQIIKGDPNKIPVWQSIKFTGIPSENLYNIWIRGESDNDIEPDTKFWLIDDVRFCTLDEIRVYSNTMEPNVQDIKCEAVENSTWSMALRGTDRSETFHCPNLGYIGPFCNISCQSIFDDEFCSKNLVCQEDASGLQYKCLCTPGSYGEGCKDSCLNGRYGYNCAKECGHCAGSHCNYYNGECPSGCEEGYAPPLCETHSYPKLLVPPSIVYIGYNSIQFELKNLSTNGQMEASTFRIEYTESPQTSVSKWKLSEEEKDFKLNEKITVTNLRPYTSYIFRAILYTESKKYLHAIDIPTVPAMTQCKVERLLNIEPAERTVTIQLLQSEDDVSCSAESYYIELNEKTYSFQINNVVIDDLLPFKTYVLSVRNNIYRDYIGQETFTTLEDAPLEVLNLQFETITNDSALISWEEPQYPNGNIKGYIVSYEAKMNVFCDSPFQETKPVRLYEYSNSKLLSLEPYTIYEINVMAVTVKEGPKTSINITTKQNDYLQPEELPIDINIQPNINTVRVVWKIPECSKIKGPVSYIFHIECDGDIWCKEDKFEKIEYGSSLNLDNTYTHIENLIPFTKYLVKMFTARMTERISVFDTKFQTKETVPPMVGNLTVYSRNKTSVSVRWKDPYPPYGEIESYEVSYRDTSYYRTFTKSYKNTSNCTFWDSYHCHVINGLQSNKKYEIKVSAKNKHVRGENSTFITTITREGRSTPPVHLTSNWEKNILNLSWEHPDISNGVIKYFHIYLQLNETELQDLSEKEHSIKVPVKELNKTYSYQINKTVPYSTSYEVDICAVNKFLGENASLFIDTPPEKPHLTGPITLNENILPSNTSFAIEIPGANATTMSKDSYLLVVVTERHPDLATDIKNYCLPSKIIAGFESSDFMWIAAELEPPKTTLIYQVGDNTKTDSKYLERELWNKELKPVTEYQVKVVLVNQYKSKQRCQFYEMRESVKTIPTYEPSGGLYALLILLLLPVLMFLAYRYYTKKKDLINNIKASENISGVKSPDIIPLAPASRVHFNASQHVEQNERQPLNREEITQSNNEIKKTNDEITKGNEEVKKRNEEIKKSNDEILEKSVPYHSRLVLLKNFEDYVKQALETNELQEQHALFPRGKTKPWDYGVLEQNKSKNRYNNLSAYDSTRVKLSKINDDPYSDYINANYINGYHQKKAYIATQGPKVSTVKDFWRMIWQEKVKYIIMLANIIEGGKKKCEQYWPEGEKGCKYGNIQVKFLSSELYADFVYRNFDVHLNGETRRIEQYHFISWPDHGVPLYPQSLVTFLKMMLKIPQGQSPTVVHCSAGVGRTGTIILCDICLRMAAREGAVDVLRYLHEIRDQRANMVDNIDQYKLVHLVLLECLLSPVTTLPCSDLKVAVGKLIAEGTLQIQLNQLENISWRDNVYGYSNKIKLDAENKIKNRFPDIIPDVAMIYLPRYPAEDSCSDYINAVPVDGFRFKDQFIVTQLPLPNTLEDFWRMVSHKCCKVIVSLNDIPENDKTCCKCWPESEDTIELNCGITLKHFATQSYELCDIFNIILHDKREKKKNKLNIIQFKNWKHDMDIPQKMEDFVTLYEETDSLSRGKYPVVVMCHNGATASGIYVCFSFMIEKMKLEQQCDAYLAIRVIRRNRKLFVTNKHQLQFLYTAAVQYMNTYDTYANFQVPATK